MQLGGEGENQNNDSGADQRGTGNGKVLFLENWQAEILLSTASTFAGGGVDGTAAEFTETELGGCRSRG